METPEEQGYCDFCKEPFRKKPEAPAAPVAKPAQQVVVPPEVMEKLLSHKNAPGPSASPYAPEIPPEFAELGDGERIAELPPVAKKAAWAFLALVVLWTAVGMAWFASKARRLEGRPPAGLILPPHEAIRQEIPAPAPPPVPVPDPGAPAPQGLPSSPPVPSQG